MCKTLYFVGSQRKSYIIIDDIHPRVEQDYVSLNTNLTEGNIGNQKGHRSNYIMLTVLLVMKPVFRFMPERFVPKQHEKWNKPVLV